MGYVNTCCGWAVIIVIGGLLYYVSQDKTRKATAVRESRERTKSSQKEKDTKTRKAKNAGDGSGNEAQKKVKTKKEPVEPAAPTYDDSPEEKVDDLAFARQFANAQTGTSMAPKSETGSRQKSVKLSKAMAPRDDDELKKIHAEQGSDGDDDLSSAASPEFNATTPKSGDVSDMLEKTTSGPSVLRLTEPTTQQPSKPKKAAPKPKEPELTQKQRQNKAKKEQERVQREEHEKERRKLEEAQRRRAREAEGRSAKDGSSTIYTPPPPKNSAWDKTSNGASSNESKNVELLETFVPSAAPTQPKSESSETQGNHQVPSHSAPLMEAYANLSEEEQIRKLGEDDGWNEVVPKKSNRKLSKITSSEAVSTETPTNGTNKFDGFEVEA